MRNLYR